MMKRVGMEGNDRNRIAMASRWLVNYLGTCHEYDAIIYSKARKPRFR